MISVLSMKGVTNNDVTDFYMETIYLGCKKVEETTRFTWDNLPPNDCQVIVSTIIEAGKLMIRGYKNVGLWIQGILPEESYLKHHSIVRKTVLELIERSVLKRANIIFVVSEEMLRHYREKYSIDITEKAVIMPCFNTEITEKSFINKTRYSKRVFCYAGSMAPWQCFDETVELYAKLEEQLDDCELRIFTRETDVAERKCSGKIKHYTVKACTNEELQEELRETTFGFIIRSDIEVNRVATPTKISSYLGNGVIPIITTSLRSFSEASRGTRCVCELKTVEDYATLLNEVKKTHDPEIVENDIRDIYNTYFNRAEYINGIERAVGRIKMKDNVKDKSLHG